MTIGDISSVAKASVWSASTRGDTHTESERDSKMNAGKKHTISIQRSQSYRSMVAQYVIFITQAPDAFLNYVFIPFMAYHLETSSLLFSAID